MSFGSRIKPEDIRGKTTDGQFLSSLVVDHYIDRILQPCNSYLLEDFEDEHKVKFGYLSELATLIADPHYYNKPTLNDEGIFNFPWIAGGAVLSAFDKQPGDIDIFFPNSRSFIHTVELLQKNNYYFTDEDLRLIEKNMSAIKFVQAKPTKIVSLDPNDHTNKNVQLIKMMWYGTPHATLMSFDISVCKLAIANGQVIAPDFTIQDIKNKRLTVNTRFAGSGIHRRIKKYYDRGYRFGDPLLDNLFAEQTSLQDENVVQEIVIRDTGESSWNNPQYRYDYYHLDAWSFKNKWENKND